MNFVIYYGSTLKKNMKKVLDVLEESLQSKGHTYTIFDHNVLGCTNCGGCKTHSKCIIKDSFPTDCLQKCDGIILMSPIFFFGFSSKTKSFLDRLYSVNLEGKVLTAITLSGSDTLSEHCGVDIIDEVLYRTHKYCGCLYVPPINFVTYDREIESIESHNIDLFVESIGRCLE